MSSSRRRILCAEPHEDTCRLITLLLEQQGHEVVSATTVQACLQLVGEGDFDIYMLDDDYIDGTSIELCKRLREMTPGTPVLFFSSQAFLRDRERAFEAGAYAYLVKPDDLFDIVQIVNSILAGISAHPRAGEAENP
ncbi:MAG: two-component system, OmpR family, manganese sensing response regulator [Acidobacteriota bacterium]|jgi:two-component system OmpR family response regulator|nr:two-component system, OmpR family, manganese sensing response regulator [Acidobacteriota bacterium]